jgi:hypothetical protein
MHLMRTYQRPKPLAKVVTHSAANKAVEGSFALSQAMRHLAPAILSSLLIPGIALLDLILFTITRPSCAACASLAGYFANYSMTISFIQGNKAIQNALVIFRKTV